MYLDPKAMCFLYKHFSLNSLDFEGSRALFETCFSVTTYGSFMYIKVSEERISDQTMMCLFPGDHHDYPSQAGDYGPGTSLTGAIICLRETRRMDSRVGRTTDRFTPAP